MTHGFCTLLHTLKGLVGSREKAYKILGVLRVFLRAVKDKSKEIRPEWNKLILGTSG